ncbi:hypothetical protein LSAT2_026716 [Lamellibrachia satsuma]|nr:hypothetical protein LSAT2_026716 [Lamellibrachia satsuma]
MEEELTCAVCQEIYKEPMLLRCGHSYCKTCLDSIVRSASQDGIVAMCPLRCGPIAELQCSFKLKSIVSKYKQQQQQQKIKKQQKKQKEDRTLGQEICGMHQGQRAYLYCKKCATAVCPLCLCDAGIGQHVGHVVITLEERCSHLKEEAVQVEDQGKELIQTVDDIISDVTKCGEDIEKLRTEYDNTVVQDYDSVIKILEDWRNETLQAMSREAEKLPFPQGLHQHQQDIRKLCDSAKSLDFPLSLREIAAGVAKLEDLKLRMCNFKTYVEVSKTQKDLALTNWTADNLEDFFKKQVRSFSREANNCIKAFEQVMAVRIESLYVMPDYAALEKEKQFEEADARANLLSEQVTSLESQVADSQDTMNEETRQKVAAHSMLMHAEEKMKLMQDQLQAEEEQRKAMEQKVDALTTQMVDMGKTLESAEGLVGGYEELKKKMQNEIEVLQLRSEQLLAENDQLDKVKMKLQSEVEDSNVEIETLHQLLGELEKLDHNLDEEKVTTERLAMELDTAERESRQKETTIINLTLELDELRDRLEEVERLRITQARELDELTLDVCKSKLRTDYSNMIATVIKTLEQYNFPLSIREIAAGVGQLQERKLTMCHFETHVEGIEQEGMEHVMGSSTGLAQSRRGEEKLISLVDNFNGKIKNLRSRISALEERQKMSDKNLGEEKAISKSLAMQRDNAERESREKETTILNQTRELSELRDRLVEVERLAAVHPDFFKERCARTWEVEPSAGEPCTRAAPQGTGDATLRLDVNMEALREQYDRELQPREEAGEDKKTTQECRAQ